MKTKPWFVYVFVVVLLASYTISPTIAQSLDSQRQARRILVFLTGQAAARQMVKQGGGGTIINMSSINAVVAIPNIVPYVTAKGGVNQLTKAMAMALADKGIRVNGIGPGSIMTEMLKSVANDKAAMHKVLARTPMGRAGEPSEIGKVAVFLASEDSSYMTGEIVYVDGGRLALNYTVPVAE